MLEISRLHKFPTRYIRDEFLEKLREQLTEFCDGRVIKYHSKNKQELWWCLEEARNYDRYVRPLDNFEIEYYNSLEKLIKIHEQELLKAHEIQKKGFTTIIMQVNKAKFEYEMRLDK